MCGQPEQAVALLTQSRVQDMQDASKQAGPVRRRAALTASQWTSSLGQPDRPHAYRAAILLLGSDDFVIRMAGVSLLSVRPRAVQLHVATRLGQHPLHGCARAGRACARPQAPA